MALFTRAHDIDLLCRMERMMVNRVSRSLIDSIKLEAYLKHCRQSKDRLHAVQWICKTMIAYGFSSETRDLSIQLLDKFLMESLSIDANSLVTLNLTLYGSTTSMIVASKMLEINPMTPGCFRQFNRDVLVDFEKHFLKILNFDCAPQRTPSYFLRTISELMLNAEHKDTKDLIKTCDRVIGNLLEVSDCITFEPHVMALSVLISCTRIDIVQFLQRMPICITAHYDGSMDKCLQTMSAHLHATVSTSPIKDVTPKRVVDLSSEDGDSSEKRKKLCMEI